MNSKITRLDYCQFLLSSQINYTLTYFADHVDEWSHDMIRHLSKIFLAIREISAGYGTSISGHFRAYKEECSRKKKNHPLNP